MLLRNFLPVSLAYIHFTVRKPSNREGLMISPNHILTKRSRETLFMEGNQLTLQLQKRGKMSVNWIIATENFQVLTNYMRGGNALIPCLLDLSCSSA